MKSSTRGTFPSRGSEPSFRDRDPVEPRKARRGEVVTLHGEDLYGIREIRVGGRRARIVGRGFRNAQILIPEHATDGSVTVNGVAQKELELSLVDDDSNNYGSVT